jgi:hypothetical protein
LLSDDDDDILDTTGSIVPDKKSKVQINPNANTIEYSKINRVEHQISEVIDQVKSNVNKVIERGDHLDTLNTKSEQISASANVFQNRARHTRKAMLRTCRVRLSLSFESINCQIELKLFIFQGASLYWRNDWRYFDFINL